MSAPPCPLRLRDRRVVALAAGATALLVAAWVRREGWPLADSVEYLRLAGDLVDGGLAPSAERLRSPAYPLTLAPLHLLFAACGLEDLRPLAFLARALSLVASLVAVLVTARAVARTFGARAGTAAGWAVALNPVFLFHGTDPLPESLAGACLVLGLERVLRPDHAARASAAFGAGLLLGASALLSYKTLPLVAATWLALVARDRWRGRTSWTQLLAGLVAILALELVLDRAVYGRWGLSLANYLVYNVGFVAVSVLVHVGASDAAARVFELAGRYYDFAPDVTGEAIARHVEDQSPVTWYVTHLDEFLGWPLLALFLVGLVHALRRPRWSTATIVAVLLLHAVVLGHKDAKSFRQWLPALPLVAALVGVGFDALRTGPRAWRTAAVVAFVLAVPTVAWRFERLWPRANGHYWRAVDWVEEQLPADDARRTLGAPGATVLFRTSPRLVLAPLAPPRADTGATPAERVAATLETFDWLLLEERLLDGLPHLRPAVEARFDLEASFFEPGNDPEAGPVHAFRRRASR